MVEMKTIFFLNKDLKCISQWKTKLICFNMFEKVFGKSCVLLCRQFTLFSLICREELSKILKT